LRGVDLELQSGLVNGLSELGEEIADRFLAVVEHVAGGRTVDGVGDVTTELLEAFAERNNEGVRGYLG
jgi:hypothetical protein